MNCGEMLFKSFKKEIMAVQEKCFIDLTSREHVQIGSMQFLKLCSNLCLLRILKPNLNVSNFRPKR